MAHAARAARRSTRSTADRTDGRSARRPESARRTGSGAKRRTGRLAAARSTPLPRGPELSRRQLVRITLLLGMMTALGPATVDMYLPALPQLESEFLTSTASVQATLTGSLLGMACGQLLMGPLSDTIGRRRPLLAGVGVHVLSSLAMIGAPTIGVLMALRVLQGFGAASGAIIALAIVRDLFVGRGASTMLSRLVLVTGIAPVLAPAVGGFMLSFTGWRGIFLVLAAVSLVVIVLCGLALPETLPPERRIPAAPRAMASTVGILVRDRIYVGALLTQALMFAASFSYVSGMSFILQDGYGLSPGEFGYLFSAGTFGMIAMSQVNPILLRRFSPGHVLVIGLAGVVAMGATMTALTSLEIADMWGLIVPLWAALAFQQLITPNAQTIALAHHGHRAGTAAAFLTASTSVAGALAAPLLGFVGTTAVTLAVVMLGFYVLSATATATLVRRSGIRASDVDGPPVIPPARDSTES
ncbi:multidrug effflux MFS transporter [Pseudactinotalea sp. HY158]|uniref:multidrug effflux MFS transporter n=1 Tax=Pseudactinotalea sp. HY158 TaxID=2654547 RepID=UPI00129CA89F|nr:multidrug effflux MFS transporter [Pseudactinotalea sp. HY158]QGH69435.1 Bcr/CflA family efflux MFS transporter [Pseudactinotalea sp. HY158]